PVAASTHPIPSAPKEAITRLPTTAGVGDAGVLRACSDGNFSMANNSTSCLTSPDFKSTPMSRRLAPPVLLETEVLSHAMPCATTGDDQPWPGMADFQMTFLSLLHTAGTLPSIRPNPPGPRNCGQGDE